MVKFSPVSILLIILLSVPAGLLAQDATTDAPEKGARYSRHVILPFLGYQSLNGEKTSFSFLLEYSMQYPDTTFIFTGAYPEERDSRAPAFGMTYRFRASHMLNFDASFAVINDGVTRQYDAKYTTYGYSNTFPLYVRRSNTMLATVGAGYNIPLPKKFQWLGANVWGAAGYAWRTIEVTNDWGTGLTTTQSNADRMIMGRVGAEAMLWNGNMMMIMGSMFYGHFIPTDSDIDPFGGIGWSLAVFPMWIDQ